MLAMLSFISRFQKKFAEGVYDKETSLVKFRNCCWFTNFDHGKRHQPLQLMSMDDNLKFNKKLKSKESYDTYDNYDAIEVPFTDAIPKDYDGVMGVPISFLDKYNPEQFELLGIMNTGEENKGMRYPNTPHGRPVINGEEKYIRILIRKQKGVLTKIKGDGKYENKTGNGNYNKRYMRWFLYTVS